MNRSVKKLTEASILTSLFIVITMLALITGIGYGLYLDFGVPIMFALIYFRCDLKYTLMCGISSIAIIMLILGNFAAAIIISQSFLLGIMCGYLISLNSNMFDDLFWGSIAGVIFMILIDIYARNLIGYSFMEEFQGYASIFKYKDLSNTIYYMFIAIFPFGMVFSIYFVSLIVGKKIKLLKGFQKRKYLMMKSLRNLGGFMSISKKNYCIAVIYILIFNLLSIIDIEFSNVYIKTITICIEYLCFYFVIRDSYMMIGNFIYIKYRNRILNIIYMILVISLLVFFFKVTTYSLIILSTIMDKKIGLRARQENVVKNHISKFEEILKI